MFIEIDHISLRNSKQGTLYFICGFHDHKICYKVLDIVIPFRFQIILSVLTKKYAVPIQGDY